jgi:hypothetical protein
MQKTSDTIRPKLTVREIAKRRAAIVQLVEELPEATTTKHGTHLSLEIRGKRFGWYLENHHGDGRVALNCKAPRGVSESLSRKAPEQFHIPKHVGHHGWVGVWLDLPETDWSEVASILADAYRMTAPSRLTAQI